MSTFADYFQFQSKYFNNMYQSTNQLTKLLTFLCLFLSLNIVQSQTQTGFEVLNKKFKHYEIATVNSEDVYRQINTSSRSNDVVLDLGDGMKWNLELELNPIFSSKYTKVFGNQVSGNPVQEGRVKPMKGKLKNVPDSEVAISFNKNFIFGEVRIGTTAYFIEPLSYHVKGQDPDKFIYYSINDIIMDVDYKCGNDYYKEEMEKFSSKEENIGTRMPGGCFIVEYAIAADWSMVVKFGNDVAVENHITGVVNNVQTNWDNEFDDEIQFEIVTFWISSCSTCDPWSNSTNSSTVLNSFTSWANAGSFGVTHDVGSMWSNRVYIDNIVGLAWVNVICTSNRYNILRDFTSNANQLRVMTSHELGHNFRAVNSPTGHDAAGSGFIMAPSVNTSNTWSAQSIIDIEGHYLSRWCLSNCTNLPPPVADFDFTVVDNCVVGQVQYTDQSTGATAWAWSFPGGTPATSNQQNPLVSYNNAGTYGATLTVTNAAGNDSHTITNAFTIGETPNASFTYTVSGATVTFTNTSTNATSYSWDFGDGNLSTATNPVHTYGDDGFYTVVLTAFNSCGPDVFTEIIEIATPPVAGFSANPVSGCVPLSVNFIDESSSNTIQWIWNFEGGVPETSFSQNPSVIFNAPGMYSVTLTAINAQGTNTLVRQNYIEVIPNPESSFTYTQDGLTLTFTNTSTNATDYLWNFGDGNTSIVPNPVHTYTSPGTYTVTLQSSNDCANNTSSQEIIITLAPIASFTTNNPSTGCSPYTVQFLSTSQNNPTAYLWTFEGGNPATSTEQNPSVVYNNPGSYDVELVVTNADGSDMLLQEDFILIESVPTASFTVQTTGLTISLTSNLQNANTVSWDFDDGNSSQEENPVHTYSTEGNYTIVMTATNDCGKTIISQVVNILLAPVASFTLSPTEGCIPLTVQFTNTSTPNTTQLVWSFPGGTPSTSSDPNPVVVYNSVGSFNVSLTASNPAGQNTFSQNDVVQTRTVPATGFTTTVDGATVTLTNTASNTNQTEWLIQDNGLQQLQGQQVSYTFSANGSYSIRQININDCGESTLEEFIVINVFPIANFIGVADNNCAPATLVFNNASSNGTDFLWTFENGDPASSTEENPTVIFNEAGQFTISLTVSNQYGSNTTSQTITILTVAEPEFTYIGNALSYTFQNQTFGSNNTYLWDFGDGNQSTEVNPNHVYGMPGTYSVSLTVTNECGSNTEETLIIIDNRAPMVDFTANPVSGCAPLKVDFTDISENDPETWAWVFNGGNPSVASTKDVSVTYENEGIYNVVMTASNGFGSGVESKSNYITVYGNPEANFEFTVLDGEVTTQYTGTLVSSYFWDFGDGNRSAQTSPRNVYTKSGTYTIILIVENPCGTDTITKDVTITLTSVYNPELDKVITIAPNPNNGKFNMIIQNLEGQNINIEIINILGVTLLKTNHRMAQNKEIIPFEILNLTPGNYFVKVLTERGEGIIKKLSITE
ncbi:MAG: PKD domain-containing protein [Saprospiraceae bacterium]|nr:PKD domain-containing protein [Saprospiraceae bacterium]